MLYLAGALGFLGRRRRNGHPESRSEPTTPRPSQDDGTLAKANSLKLLTTTYYYLLLLTTTYYYLLLLTTTYYYLLLLTTAYYCLLLFTTAYYCLLLLTTAY